jgi:RNA polymerase sigma-70 factor (ECF subfamily)
MPFEPRTNKLSDDPLFNDIRYDPTAFEMLFKKYFTVLCAHCQYKYCFDLDLAKEAVHTGFVKLWETRQTISTDLSVQAYLYKIVNNTCLDIIRHQNVKRKHEKYVLQHSTESATDNDFDVRDIKILKEAIDKAVSELPDKMRMVFELSRYEGLKYAQIASRLNLSVKTVETQISRALLKLRQKLKSYYTGFCIIFLLIENYFFSL